MINTKTQGLRVEIHTHFVCSGRLVTSSESISRRTLASVLLLWLLLDSFVQFSLIIYRVRNHFSALRQVESEIEPPGINIPDKNKLIY